MNLSKIKEQFNELGPKYKKLAALIKGSIEDSLAEKNIGYARTEYRIKTWDSFLEKMNREQYTDPFKQINDFCGFRIIVRNSEEIERICGIIAKEFNVLKYEPNDPVSKQFGYQSYHMVVSIKEDWRVVPGYRNYTSFRFEVQIRSTLMDTWANISHQIFYKKGELKKDIERKLYRLSALMEIGDIEISQLINLQSTSEILTDRLLNLQGVLDEYLPDRKRVLAKPLEVLLDEMETYNFSLDTLKKYLNSQTKKDLLFKIEHEAFSEQRNIPSVESRWWQVGVVRGLMYLTIDSYWQKAGLEYEAHFVKTINLYRKDFKFAP